MSVEAIVSRINMINASISSLSPARPASQSTLSAGSDMFGSTNANPSFQETMARAAAASVPTGNAQLPTTSPGEMLTSALDPSSQTALTRQTLESIAQRSTPTVTDPVAAPLAPTTAAPASSSTAPTLEPKTVTTAVAAEAPKKSTTIDAPSVPAKSSKRGEEVVRVAKKYLGVPYVWGGNNPRIGLDCSGLVKLVFKELGYEMPRVARQQATKGREIESMSQAQPGDLIGMRKGKHIAIYLGDNKILHAPQPGEKVSIRSLHSRDVIDTIRRITP